MLPISPSPLRDDGYDVSDYCDIHPRYGSRDDFKRLVQEAHKRDIRIVVELVPNHTSDQHAWFQASHDPNHPEHEKYKDYYVWNEDDQKYRDARIIFIDSEKSNWTFDPLRKAYYWHRFFFHQPDLNYDNPMVQQAMLDVVKYWIEDGADAIRVDAPPYLIEREDTNCENLPETHKFLKKLRSFVDTLAPGTMLLSEANQWPEDVIHYFGAGDEMHMNFHFPLMPRLFMAIAKADRTPIEEILARTPQLPATCQWATFLRCHDELTLEMVTGEECEWMWNFYAPEPRMRLNRGIRRRLAPLLENDPRKIMLLNSLLFTMGGSPFIYYGDEIGMGDNIWLEDRNGLRTPMQWTGGKNAGFSAADTDVLFAPVISDDRFGYQTLNVEAQEKDSISLLNQMRQMINIRKKYTVFGCGDFQWVEGGSTSVAAYLRKDQNSTLLILNNLSSQIQPFQIPARQGGYQNIWDGKFTSDRFIRLQPYEYVWLLENA